MATPRRLGALAVIAWRAYCGAALAQLCLRLWGCHTGVNAATMEQRETASM
jgi:hypothetical protein